MWQETQEKPSYAKEKEIVSELVEQHAQCLNSKDRKKMMIAIPVLYGLKTAATPDGLILLSKHCITSSCCNKINREHLNTTL